MNAISNWIDKLKLEYELARGEFAYFRDPDELMRRAMAFDMSILPDFDQDTRTSFDFDYLDDTTARLKPVPRGRTLKKLMKNLAKGAKNDIEVFERLMLFTQTVSWNFMSRQPVHRRPSGMVVSDPILLLEFMEMRCGHVARLVCDLALAHGWKARIVQVGGHVTAEVEVDGRWRLADADVYGGGVIPKLPNGEYGSVAEFSHCPDELDRPFSFLDGTIMMPDYRRVHLPGNLTYPSYHYFSTIAYAGTKPIYMYKDPEFDAEGNKFYGWTKYLHEDATDIQLSEFELQAACGGPSVTNISNVDGKVWIDWAPVDHQLSQAALYKVFFYKERRGWQANRFIGNEALQKFWTSPMPASLELYKRLAGPFPAENVIETTDTFIELPVQDLASYQYFTVMAFDARALELGRERGNVSFEFAIPHGESPVIKGGAKWRQNHMAKLAEEEAKKAEAEAQPVPEQGSQA